MKLLALDCSTKSCSITLSEGKDIIAHTQLHTKITHSETLLPMVEYLLNTVGWTCGDIEGFVVGKGPGSFTGVRIGLSLIKGLSFGRNTPCFPLSSLLGLAYQCVDIQGNVLALMDARKSEFYSSLYELKEGKPRQIWEEKARNKEEILEKLKEVEGPIYLVGDGAEPFIQGEEPQQYRIASPLLKHHNSTGLLLGMLEEYPEGKGIDGEALRPNYLRLSQAEKERLEKGEQ